MTRPRGLIGRRLACWLGGLMLLALAAILWQAYSAYRDGLRLAVVRVAPRGAPAKELDFSRVGSADRLAQPAPAEEPPRNIVLFIGDGMGFNQVGATRMARLGVAGRLTMERMPITGWSWTHSLTGLYTDSAAGASAIATGHKVEPLTLSQAPDGTPHRTLAEAGLARGMRVGMITSSVIFDATPSAFLAHAASRRDYQSIVEQMAASGAELLISEGWVIEDEDDRERFTELTAPFERAGFKVVTAAAEIAAAVAEPAPVLGLLEPGSVVDPERGPNLAELTELALGRLAVGEHGFFLMVEDEESDTGSHLNDFDRVVTGLGQLDEAVALAIEFAERDGRTLVLVTADHETGGLTLPVKHGDPRIAYRWDSTNHTAVPVPHFAYGPGAERFSGVHDNTDLGRLMAEILGLELD